MVKYTSKIAIWIKDMLESPYRKDKVKLSLGIVVFSTALYYGLHLLLIVIGFLLEFISSLLPSV